MKPVYAFFAGAVAMLAAVYGTGLQTPAVMFAAGAVAPVAIAAAALSSPRRMRAAAGKLEQLAQMLSATRPGASSKPASGSAIAGTVEAELTAALKQLGATKPAAIAAARQAVQAQPCAPFAEQLRAAIGFTRVEANR